MAKKLSRNAPCPCGSGKKIKHCCGEKARTWKPIDFGSFQTAGPLRVRPVAQTIQESSIVQWLIDCARRMTLKAMQPSSGPGDVLIALLLTVTAAEAAANRLLEALVSQAEWEGKDGAKSVEKLPFLEKWEKLSDLLRLTPPLRRGEGALQAFRYTLQARHDLVHFKHGKNAKVFEARGPEQVLYDVPANIEIDAALLSAPKDQVVSSPVEESLQGTKAEGYYLSFANVLMPVLDASPMTDPSLRHAIREMRVALGVEQDAAPVVEASGAQAPTSLSEFPPESGRDANVHFRHGQRHQHAPE
jgi:hypothetical protein